MKKKMLVVIGAILIGICRTKFDENCSSTFPPCGTNTNDICYYM